MTPEQLWNGAVRNNWTTNPHPTPHQDLPGSINSPINVDSPDNNPPPQTRNQIRRDRYKERRRAEHAKEQRARYEGTRPTGRINSPIDVDAPSPHATKHRLLTPPFDPQRIHENTVSSLLLEEFNSSVNKMHNDQDARGAYHDLAMKAITSLRAVETDLH